MLRQDNADRRLTPIAHELGLIGAHRKELFDKKLAEIDRGIQLLKDARVGNILGDVYLRRPEVTWETMFEYSPELRTIGACAAQQCAYDIKYEGYVSRQKMEVEKAQRLAGKLIPPTFDYERIVPLRNEAKEKFTRIRPANLDQAKRISGITPADIALVLAHLESS